MTYGLLGCGNIGIHTAEIAKALGMHVVSTEPIHGDNPLLKAKNCIITPHMSWGAKGSRQRIMDTTVDNVKAWLARQLRNMATILHARGIVMIGCYGKRMEN